MFGDKLKEIRMKKGWSQQKLAQEANLSFSLIGKLEQNINKEFTIQTAVQLADAFKISLDSLIGRKIPK